MSWGAMEGEEGSSLPSLLEARLLSRDRSLAGNGPKTLQHSQVTGLFLSVSIPWPSVVSGAESDCDFVSPS